MWSNGCPTYFEVKKTFLTIVDWFERKNRYIFYFRIYSPSELTQRSMTNVRADDGSAASGLGEEKLANEEDISYLNGSRRVLIIRDNRLYRRLEPNQVPVVYSPSYNIGFMGLEKLHPFDSQKWGNVYKLLIGELLWKG